MTWIRLVIEALLALVCIYWRDRALEAEKELEAWDRWAEQMNAYAEGLEADLDPGIGPGLLPTEYRDDRPGRGPQNAAQLFNYANEAFFYRWLDWKRRHD